MDQPEVKIALRCEAIHIPLQGELYFNDLPSYGKGVSYMEFVP